jgi:hypothetical protein
MGEGIEIHKVGSFAKAKGEGEGTGFKWTTFVTRKRKE